MTDKPTLSHLDEHGQAHMVDVSQKSPTVRVARAEGFITVGAQALELALSGQAKKGDVLATARIAGIMAAKKTAELIPLCHPLPVTKVSVEITPEYNPHGLRVESLVKVTAQTGVEMEALTAVSITCLTLYDMLKSVDKSMIISDMKLVEKTGGRSGSWLRG